MRISELMQKLQETLATDGDLRLLLPYGEVGFEDLAEVTVEEVYFDVFEGSTSGTHCLVSEAQTYGSELRTPPEPGKAVILDTGHPPLRRAA